MKAKKVYEFVQNKDIKADIGTSVLQKRSIIQWINKWIPDADYDIDDNLNITIYHIVDLSHTEVTDIPNNLTVESGFILRDCKNLKELPNNLTVHGNLYLSFNLQLKNLPNNLTVGGNLFMQKTNISTEPSDLKLDGIIIGNKITGK